MKIKTSGPIVYRKLKSGGYQLTADWWCETGIKGNAARIGEFGHLDQDGRVLIKAGYRWDGCSGPAIDRRTNMRCGLLHDFLYQLMRMSKLPQSYRKQADQLFRSLYRQDGGNAVMGLLDYIGLRIGASHAAKVQPEAEVAFHSAP
jgi:hypothetical protein